MICYRRVFWDMRISDFSDFVNIYYYSQIPNYQISQTELASLVNSNQQNLSLEYKVNENIYAILRCIPFQKEVKIPIDEKTIFDAFFFPTPITNKTITGIDPTKIVTIRPYTILSKLESMGTDIFSHVEDLAIPKDNNQIGINTFYKKFVNGLVQVYSIDNENPYIDYDIYAGLKKYNDTTLTYLNVGDVTVSNSLNRDLSFIIPYKVNPTLNTIEHSQYNELSVLEKVSSHLDTTSYTKKQLLDFNDVGKNSNINSQLNSQQVRQTDQSEAIQSNELFTYGCSVNRDENNTLISKDNQICHDISENCDLTMYNLLSNLDLTDELIQQVLNSNVYKLCQRFFDLEPNNPVNLFTEENIQLANSLIDCSQRLIEDSFFYDIIHTMDSSFAENNKNQMTSATYDFELLVPKQLLKTSSILRPFSSQSHILQDRINPSKLYVAYDIRYLTENSILLLESNDFSYTYNWFILNTDVLQNLKFNQHILIFDITQSDSNIEYSLSKRFDLLDEDLLDWTGDAIQIYNNYLIYTESEDITDKFVLAKTNTTISFSSEIISNDSMKVNELVELIIDIYDESNNLLTTFNDASRCLTSIIYSCPSGFLDETLMEIVESNQYNDIDILKVNSLLNKWILDSNGFLLVNHIKDPTNKLLFYNSYVKNDIIYNQHFTYNANSRIVSCLTYCTFDEFLFTLGSESRYPKVILYNNGGMSIPLDNSYRDSILPDDFSFYYIDQEDQTSTMNIDLTEDINAYILYNQLGGYVIDLEIDHTDIKLPIIDSLYTVIYGTDSSIYCSSYDITCEEVLLGIWQTYMKYYGYISKLNKSFHIDSIVHTSQIIPDEYVTFNFKDVHFTFSNLTENDILLLNGNIIKRIHPIIDKDLAFDSIEYIIGYQDDTCIIPESLVLKSHILSFQEQNDKIMDCISGYNTYPLGIFNTYFSLDQYINSNVSSGYYIRDYGRFQVLHKNPYSLYKPNIVMELTLMDISNIDFIKDCPMYLLTKAVRFDNTVFCQKENAMFDLLFNSLYAPNGINIFSCADYTTINGFSQYNVWGDLISQNVDTTEIFIFSSGTGTYFGGSSINSNLTDSYNKSIFSYESINNIEQQYLNDNYFMHSVVIDTTNTISNREKGLFYNIDKFYNVMLNLEDFTILLYTEADTTIGVSNIISTLNGGLYPFISKTYSDIITISNLNTFNPLIYSRLTKGIDGTVDETGFLGFIHCISLYLEDYPFECEALTQPISTLYLTTRIDSLDIANVNNLISRSDLTSVNSKYENFKEYIESMPTYNEINQTIGKFDLYNKIQSSGSNKWGIIKMDDMLYVLSSNDMNTTYVFYLNNDYIFNYAKISSKSIFDLLPTTLQSNEIITRFQILDERDSVIYNFVNETNTKPVRNPRGNLYIISDYDVGTISKCLIDILTNLNM